MNRWHRSTLCLAHSILKYLEQLNKERGITVICSLHFLDLVHRYATSAIALKDGEMVFQGLPKQIDDAQFKAIYGQEAERVSIFEIWHDTCFQLIIFSPFETFPVNNSSSMAKPETTVKTAKSSTPNRLASLIIPGVGQFLSKEAYTRAV